MRSAASSFSRLRHTFVAPLTALVLLTTSVRAQDSSAPADSAANTADPARQQAEALKQKGDALFRERQYVDAVTTYEQAYAAYPDPRVLYNKGRALQALGRYGDALQALTRFQQDAPAELRAQLPGLINLIGELRQRVTEVTVRVNVPGSQIMLGTSVVSVSPMSEPLLVNAGKARLRVVQEGYFPFEREVTLQGGGTASFDVTLQSMQRHGKLVVRSNLAGTDISVDGRHIGQAPTEVVLLAGTHEVTARREGYNDASTQVVLEVGQNRALTLDPLEKKKALYQQWWFWGGVGVVAAGAATTVILLTRDNGETEGNFNPGVISADAGVIRF